MQPQQQPGGVVPGPANQYDFIVHPPSSPPPKSPMTNLGGNASGKKFLLIVGGGLGLVLMLLLVVLLFSGGNPEVDRALGITQAQQELVRVSEESVGDAVDQQLKNSAVTTQLTVTTQQLQWRTFLADEGREVKDDELNLKMDADTDTYLETARQSATFDSAFADVLDTQLRNYASELNLAFQESDDSSVRELAAAHFEQLELLVKQLPQEE